MVDVVFAPAKLTVSLRITGVRDDGYHLIDAEMVSLDLADRLMISEGDGLEVVGPAAGIASGDSNLVRRAPSGWTPRPRPGRQAHPPVPGSAEGRATPRRSCGGPASTISVAASVGADVPFCLEADGRGDGHR